MGRHQTLLGPTAVTVSTGTPVILQAKNTASKQAYLVIRTSALVNTPSLQVDIIAADKMLAGSGAYHSLAAITTAKTVRVLLNSNSGEETPAGMVDEEVEWPIPTKLGFTFTCSGASASIDVEAEIDWL
jgi:hypothetical protein